jgi:hypothetical protein
MMNEYHARTDRDLANFGVKPRKVGNDAIPLWLVFPIKESARNEVYHQTLANTKQQPPPAGQTISVLMSTQMLVQAKPLHTVHLETLQALFPVALHPPAVCLMNSHTTREQNVVTLGSGNGAE